MKALSYLHTYVLTHVRTFSSAESIAQSASEELKNNSDVLANLKEVRIILCPLIRP